MTVGPKPPAEVRINSFLVRMLLEEQHADLAGLPLGEISEGWDNRVFRLGEHLAVRIPRRAASAVLIEQEQRWLPGLSVRLPLPIPVPVRIGQPGCGFPWKWSVVPWFSGRNALLTPPDATMTAIALGHFLHQLHRPAPEDAPHNPWRGIPLAGRDGILRNQLEQLERLVDGDSVLRLWDRAVSTPSWCGPPLWIHGDLHPGNLLVVAGRLSAVIDFGDLTAGDPACDLAVMWMLLPPAARPAFVTSVRGPFNAVNDHMLMRARGWAIALGLSWLASSLNDEVMSAIARTTIKAALNVCT
jgi:aminoglycoside phosphotransferase (APT) family kinase protein